MVYCCQDHAFRDTPLPDNIQNQPELHGRIENGKGWYFLVRAARFGKAIEQHRDRLIMRHKLSDRHYTLEYVDVFTLKDQFTHLRQYYKLPVRSLNAMVRRDVEQEGEPGRFKLVRLRVCVCGWVGGFFFFFSFFSLGLFARRMPNRYNCPETTVSHHFLSCLPAVDAVLPGALLVSGTNAPLNRSTTMYLCHSNGSHHEASCCRITMSSNERKKLAVTKLNSTRWTCA